RSRAPRAEVSWGTTHSSSAVARTYRTIPRSTAPRQARLAIIRAPTGIFFRLLDGAHHLRHEVAHGHLGERRSVDKHLFDGLGLLGSEVRGDARLELPHQHGHALGAALAMA